MCEKGVTSRSNNKDVAVAIGYSIVFTLTVNLYLVF